MHIWNEQDCIALGEKNKTTFEPFEILCIASRIFVNDEYKIKSCKWTAATAASFCVCDCLVRRIRLKCSRSANPVMDSCSAAERLCTLLDGGARCWKS